MKVCKQGFTYIEMLTVIALMALCFIPILRMFTESVYEVRLYSDMGTALQLGRDSMEAVKNLRLTEAQIESEGVVWYPPKNEPPITLNGQTWIVKRSVQRHTDPLEVRVEVFRTENLDQPILRLDSLIEDL
jgi:prepilin-type N-terminal cleavage/methylation domain-containing protein